MERHLIQGQCDGHGLGVPQKLDSLVMAHGMGAGGQDCRIGYVTVEQRRRLQQVTGIRVDWLQGWPVCCSEDPP
jgi:hypothetical protein